VGRCKRGPPFATGAKSREKRRVRTATSTLGRFARWKVAEFTQRRSKFSATANPRHRRQNESPKADFDATMACIRSRTRNS
jgi:hypothetical protein